MAHIITKAAYAAALRKPPRDAYVMPLRIFKRPVAAKGDIHRKENYVESYMSISKDEAAYFCRVTGERDAGGAVQKFIKRLLREWQLASQSKRKIMKKFFGAAPRQDESRTSSRKKTSEE